MLLPEQRVAELMRTGWGVRLARHLAPDVLEDLEQAFALAIREAVADRTAQCARIADSYGHGHNAAIAIRQLGKGEG